jgi:hypothetical protein
MKHSLEACDFGAMLPSWRALLGLGPLFRGNSPADAGSSASELIEATQIQLELVLGYATGDDGLLGAAAAAARALSWHASVQESAATYADLVALDAVVASRVEAGFHTALQALLAAAPSSSSSSSCSSSSCEPPPAAAVAAAADIDDEAMQTPPAAAAGTDSNVQTAGIDKDDDDDDDDDVPGYDDDYMQTAAALLAEVLAESHAAVEKYAQLRTRSRTLLRQGRGDPSSPSPTSLNSSISSGISGSVAMMSAHGERSARLVLRAAAAVRALHAQNVALQKKHARAAAAERRRGRAEAGRREREVEEAAAALAALGASQKKELQRVRVVRHSS